MSDCSHRLTELSWVAGRHRRVITLPVRCGSGEWSQTNEMRYMWGIYGSGSKERWWVYCQIYSKEAGGLWEAGRHYIIKWMSPWIIHEEHSGYFWDNLTRNMYIQYTMNYDISWVVDIFAILWIATVKTLKHNHHIIIIIIIIKIYILNSKMKIIKLNSNGLQVNRFVVFTSISSNISLQFTAIFQTSLSICKI